MKNKSYKEIINQCFNFDYAGRCHVAISMTRNKYTVYSSGFSIDNSGIVFFNPEVKIRKTYDELFKAILQFNTIVRNLVENLDWFNADLYHDVNYLKGLNKDCVY